MNYFSKGYDGYEQDLQIQKAKEIEKEKRKNSEFNEFYVKKNQSAEIIILDDELVRYNEHFYWSRLMSRGMTQPCLATKSECCYCANGNKPDLVCLMTVKDMTGYVDSNGVIKGVGFRKLYKTKGKTLEALNELRQLVARRKAEEMWANKQQVCRDKGCNSLEEVIRGILIKGNVLKNTRIRITVGDKYSDTTYDYLGWIQQNELGQFDTPFDYNKVIESLIIPPMQFERDLASAGINLTKSEPQPQLSSSVAMQQAGIYNPPQQQQQNTFPANSADTMYSEAPTYSADDIPF